MPEVSKIERKNVIYDIKDATARTLIQEKYKKPDEGIPLVDLNKDLQNFVTRTEKFINDSDSTKIPSKTSDLVNDSGFVAASNLKTINGVSIIGSGNIDIETGIDEEGDPVFAESPAADITDNDINTWNAKQDSLTFDETPKNNSSNPVTSGGIKSYIDIKETNIYSTIDTVESDLTAAIYYKQDNISDLQSIREGAAAGATALQPANVESNIYENQTTLVTGGAIYDALQNAVNTARDNVVYVTQQYWADHYKLEDVFAQDNTHYILTENLSYTNNSSHVVDGKNVPYVQHFGKNCVFSARKNCRLGGCTIHFNDTYIDAGLQYIFSSETANNTNIRGTFANGRILVEWFGAKGGRGVLREVEGYENPTYKNKDTYTQADRNSKAFRHALAAAGNSVVYAQASMYLLSSTVTLATTNTDNEINPLVSVPKESNASPINFTKLYVEGDLVAFDNFIGVQSVSYAGNATVDIKEPSVIKISRPNAQVIIKGAVVVPECAQDREIEIITSDLSSTYNED